MTMILSIDGGGCLGAGPAELLRLLEAAELFDEDVVAGTSVGGLLAAMRATGRSWSDISATFDKWVGPIFKKPSLLWRCDPTRPKFDDDGLLAATAAELGELRCCDVKKPFFIPAFDFANGRPKIFDHTDTDLLRDVVMRTTAAPTYFQPRESRWADGGLVANNPSAIAVCGAMHLFDCGPSDVKVLSLNTGGTVWEDPKVGLRTSAVGWVKPVISAALDGNEEIAEFQCSTMLGDRHLRLTPRLAKKYPIDDPSVVGEYRAIWRGLWDSSKTEAKAWLTK